MELEDSESDMSTGELLVKEEIEEQQDGTPASTLVKKLRRFSTTQVACLNAHFPLGMTGVGKCHAQLINKAVEETKLTPTQVKVCMEQWL